MASILMSHREVYLHAGSRSVIQGSPTALLLQNSLYLGSHHPSIGWQFHHMGSMLQVFCFVLPILEQISNRDTHSGQIQIQAVQLAGFLEEAQAVYNASKVQ